MELIDLYKKHINSNPQGAELHNFFSAFDLGVYVPHPDIETERFNQLARNKNKQAAKEWIFKHSKLKPEDNETI